MQIGSSGNYQHAQMQQMFGAQKAPKGLTREVENVLTGNSKPRKKVASQFANKLLKAEIQNPRKFVESLWKRINTQKQARGYEPIPELYNTTPNLSTYSINTQDSVSSALSANLLANRRLSQSSFQSVASVSSDKQPSPTLGKNGKPRIPNPDTSYKRIHTIGDETYDLRKYDDEISDEDDRNGQKAANTRRVSRREHTMLDSLPIQTKDSFQEKISLAGTTTYSKTKGDSQAKNGAAGTARRNKRHELLGPAYNVIFKPNR